MMMHLTNKLLAKAFFWFGMILGIFSVVTEVYGKNVYLPSDFYLFLGIFAMLGSISVSHQSE